MPLNATQSTSLTSLDLSSGAMSSMNAVTQNVHGAGTNDTDVKLMKTCRQLEGVFFNMMLKEMRKTVQDSGLVEDSGHEKEIFTEMMDQDIAGKMADTDHADNGVANMLYFQLSGRKAYAAHGAGPAVPLAAQSEEERKERFNHGTRSFTIAAPGNYRPAQVRTAYPTTAPRAIERPAQGAAGR